MGAISWAVSRPVAEQGLSADEAASSIHYCAAQGRLPDVIRLLDGDASLLHARNDDGETPLHAAADGHQVEVVQLLLARGADVGAVTSDSAQTALHYAATLGFGDVVALLLAAGADPSARDADGLRPLDVASDELKVLLRGGG